VQKLPYKEAAEGKIEGRTDVKGRRWMRCKQLP